MKLLHVVPTYVPAYRHGGPVVSVHGLCRSLAERGHQVTVFTTDVHGSGRLDVPLGAPVDRDGVETLYFPVGSPRRLYRSPAMGRALGARMKEFDLVHLHSIFLWPTSAAARVAGRAGVPYLLAPRGMLVRELFTERGRLRKTLWLSLVERRTIERAAALHVTTRLEAREAERFGLDLPRIEIVPNGIDLELFRSPLPAAEDPAIRQLTGDGVPYVLALGRLSWKKGIDRLIRAWPLLRDRTRETLLVVAGPDDEGYRPELEDLAGTMGVIDRVRFLGPVHGADKVALLAGALALALPSRSENFANVVLEALAAGTPVVVTREVGLADTVDEAGAGLVVPGDPRSLARALEKLAREPELRETLGRAGCALAERFAWPRIARAMEEVYLDSDLRRSS